ncbi:MAG TPA: hypothetical protein VFL59_04040, partial [Candidatus Nanopelagicales bacterium]|nr:hypothetical protein [Candidatus Nanopelagicales bacterium]
MAVLGLVLMVSAVVAVGAWWLLRRRGVPRAGAIALGGAVVLPGAAFLATGGETWMLVAAPLLAGAGWYVVALASARPRGTATAGWVAALVGLALAAVVVTGSLLVARGAFEVRSCSAGGAVGTDAAEVPTSCP